MSRENSGAAAAATVEGETLRREDVEKLFRDSEVGIHDVTSLGTKNAVLIAGLTAAGKSTFVNYIAGKSLRRDPQRGYVCDNSSMAIGHSATTSCTLKADALQPLPGCDFSFVDLPGFLDVRHGQNAMLMGLVTGVAMRKAATSFDTIKGAILVVDYPSLITGRAQLASDSVLNFIKFLYGDVRRDQGFLSRLASGELPIFMLLTKAEPNQLEQQRTALMSIAGELSNAQDFASRCLAGLIASQKYGFYHPLNEYPAGNDKVVTRDMIIERARDFDGIPRTDNNFLPVITPKVNSALAELIGSTYLEIGQAFENGAMEDISRGFQFLNNLLELSGGNEENLRVQNESLNSRIINLDPSSNLTGDTQARVQSLQNALNRLRELEGLANNFPAMIREAVRRTAQSVEGRLGDIVRLQESEEKVNSMQEKIDESASKIGTLKDDIERIRADNALSQEEKDRQVGQLTDQITQLTTQMASSQVSHANELQGLRDTQENMRQDAATERAAADERHEAALEALRSDLIHHDDSDSEPEMNQGRVIVINPFINPFAFFSPFAQPDERGPGHSSSSSHYLGR